MKALHEQVSRGRQARGETLSKDKRGSRNPQAKLTAEAAAQIRASAGQFTRRELADRFGVSPSRISEIIHGKAWV